MPYAKIEVGFIREHFAAVPERSRPGAIALYVQLVLTSAEMLLDGRLARVVVEAISAEVAISRGRYARREIASVASSLADSGLVEIARDGTWTVTHWREHHASREYVQGRRNADAERKREARGQETLDLGTLNVRSGRPGEVRSGQTGDSRAHARRRSAADQEQRPSPSSEVHDAAPDTPTETNGWNGAAAAEETEPPRESEIAAAVAGLQRRAGNTHRVVEARARQVSRGDFLEAVSRVAELRRENRTKNDAGLLISLLDVAIRERALAAHVASSDNGAAPTAEEIVADEARTYARGSHPWDVAADLIERQLRRRGIDDPERVIPLLDAAHAAYHGEADS